MYYIKIRLKATELRVQEAQNEADMNCYRNYFARNVTEMAVIPHLIQ